ncbi:MAG: TetR/AcrR family transcriptional regulator [Elainellaceae cyanobacterium]
MTRGPKKQFDTEATLLKAMEVFWARGYEAASLSELLKHMGIGKKSLYDTYGNKQTLFLKALDHYANTQIRSISDRLSAPGSPLENLKALLRELQEMHAQPKSCGCMIGTNIADFSTDDEAIAKVLRAYLTRLEDAFCAAIARAQAVGEVSSVADSRALARLLLCTTQGMALLGRVLKDEALLEGTTTATLALLSER